MKPITMARVSTLIGYFGLLLLITSWNAFIAPPERVPRALLLIILLLPLLFPLRGLLHARAYTHAWASFVALIYFVLGVWHSAAAEERAYGLGLVVFSLAFFLGTMFFTRLQSRALKQQTQSDDPA